MLIIRTEQIKALAEASALNFENGLIEHIKDFFPIHWRVAGEDALRSLVQLGIERAEQHGLLTEREIYLYVSLMLYLGSYFDTDPLIPWAAQYLTDKAVSDSFARIEKTSDRAMQYLDQCMGMRSEYLVSALIKAKSRLQDLSSLQDDDPMVFLFQLYPEKYDCAGQGCVMALINESRSAANRYGIDAKQGRTLYTCLAFFLGHKFEDDPQYPWAAEALIQRSGSNESEKISKLHRPALVLFEQWLS